ncbi:MAG: glycosyltransferase [Actinobacteria bacterium]|uniref:Unannotated protein n=1 Tax=freshwater metagenome TaxID=449393 RepID=A0A6J7M1W3_9ZZZZ|nr:glycosyltransferase [Actinomycetota bacterium]
MQNGADEARESIPDSANECAISVVIPFLNAESTIAEQLTAVLLQELDAAFEVVVVDHGSTDDSALVVGSFAERDPRVRLIDGSALARGGQGPPRNFGVQVSQAPLVAFCDADDIVQPGWLHAIVEALRAGARCVAVTLDYWALNPGYRESGYPQLIAVVDGASGALAIERELYLAVGGFDETVWPMADYDFCLRLKRDFGIVPVRLAEAVIWYRVRVGLRAQFQRSRLQGQSAAGVRWRRSEPPPQSTARRLVWSASRLPYLLTPRRVMWVKNSAFTLGLVEWNVWRRLSRGVSKP